MNTMISLLPAVLLFVLNVFLFFREAKLDRKKFLEQERLGDEHILREVERFLQDVKGKES